MSRREKSEGERHSPLGDRRLQGWLDAAVADATRRGLPELEPHLESLAAATEALRAADWTQDAEQ